MNILIVLIQIFYFLIFQNWGLVTYREIALLYDPQNSSTLGKIRISQTIAHELAHQWFGNLVTMNWWNDLWLNEGFATFMQFLAVDHLFPEYKMWQEFIIRIFVSALDLDALHNSHPIEVPVQRANEIEEIFDLISYYKGASIIRMLFNYIGDEDFQKGMYHYLNKWAYKNAVTEDLWDSLEEASQKPIRSMMNTWTRQMGYPVVNVSARQEGSNRVLSLSQEKFSIDGVLSGEEQQYKWFVPISIISQNNSKPVKLLLENLSQEFVMNNVEPTEWIKLNPGMTSFYRVNYSPELLQQFQSSILNR